MTTFLIVFVIAVIAVVIGKIMIDKQNAEKMKNTVENIPDFNPTQQYIGCDNLTGIFVDENSQQVSLITNRNGNMSFNKIDYKSIIESNVVENGISINKTSRTSQIGGALVGGVLLGGAGAVIGGLSGKTRSIDKVRSIELHITIDDTINPIHVIRFLNVETQKGSFLYRAANDQAQKWHSLISVLIRRADDEDKNISKMNGSIADELGKLSQLLKDGILTNEEFEIQKKKLLS